MANQQKWQAVATSPYADQAKAFLNAFWDSVGNDAEKVWVWVHKFIELDIDKKAEGFDLDEFNAHRFLESLNETKTVRQMRSEIKEADIDFNKRLSVIEYCLWKYKKSLHDFIRIPIGTQEEVRLAEHKLRESTDACEEADRTAAEAAAAFKDAAAKEKEAKYREQQAKAAEAEAVARENEARVAEAPFKKAQDELNEALANLHAQEKAYKDRTEDLTKRSESGGAVTKNKAKAELEIHLREDPLPLRQAKITTEAAERKADKVRAPFKEAREKAEKARAKATAAADEASSSAAAAAKARKHAEASKLEADAALDDAQQKVAAAEAYLNEVKKRIPKGTGWWLERELAEKKKYMPSRRK